MNAEFDSEETTRRNRPTPHPQFPLASILYSKRRNEAGSYARDTNRTYRVPWMRVIAGEYRSRRLLTLPGLDLRPTADKLRETLFNVLTAGNPGALAGSTWLDLYAGTGAVGIEALSRGAAMVHFVESSAEAADLIRKNLKSLGVA